jgi:hypothetical protein
LQQQQLLVVHWQLTSPLSQALTVLLKDGSHTFHCAQMHQAWILTGLLPHLLAIPRLFASLQIAPLVQPKTFTAKTTTPNSSPGPNE